MDNAKQYKAAPGTKCPHEHSPREYITDSVPVPVPDTAYYRRRIDDGSIILHRPPESTTPVAAIPEKKKGARK